MPCENQGAFSVLIVATTLVKLPRITSVGKLAEWWPRENMLCRRTARQRQIPEIWAPGSRDFEDWHCRVSTTSSFL